MVPVGFDIVIHQSQKCMELAYDFGLGACLMACPFLQLGGCL